MYIYIYILHSTAIPIASPQEDMFILFIPTKSEHKSLCHSRLWVVGLCTVRSTSVGSDHLGLSWAREVGGSAVHLPVFPSTLAEPAAAMGLASN